MSSLRAYLHYIKLGFLELMAYRITIIMLTLSIPITMFARYYVFKSLYENDTPVASVEGYTVRGILTYLALTVLLRSFFRSAIDRRIGRAVRDGHIVFELIRPLNYNLIMFFRAVGKSANRFMFVSLPLVLLFLFTDILLLPHDPTIWLVFLAACVNGYLLAYSLEFFIGILSFFTGYNIGLIWTFDMLTTFMAGLIVPLHFFPEQIANILLHLPFRHVFYTPAQLLLGQIPLSDAPPLLLNSFVWVIAIGLVNYMLFRIGRARLAIAGG